MNTTYIGRRGEKLAERYLKKSGYKILERNIHESHNELDIVAADKNYLVFVEVKTRSVLSDDAPLPYGSPASAVTKEKRMRTVAAARKYLSRQCPKKHMEKQPRMDVIEIYLDKTNGNLLKLNHIENAFGAN